MPSYIYNQNIDERIHRLRSYLSARDYEGTSTVMTSDLIELLDFIDNPCKDVTRLTIVDNDGRRSEERNVKVKLSFQDDMKTLKVFVEE